MRGAVWASAHPGENQSGHVKFSPYSENFLSILAFNESIVVSNLCAWYTSTVLTHHNDILLTV